MSVLWIAEIECTSVSWVKVKTSGDAPTDEEVMEAASFVANHEGTNIGEEIIVEILLA